MAPPDQGWAAEPIEQAQPSFDCAKAANIVEHALCAHADLADLDRKLADAIKAVSTVAAWTDWQRDEQNDWRRQRDACGTGPADELVRCLKTTYEVRLDEVEFMAEPDAVSTPAGRLAGIWVLAPGNENRLMALTIHPVGPGEFRLFAGGFMKDSPIHLCAFASDASVDQNGILNFDEQEADDPVSGKTMPGRIDLNGGTTTYCSWGAQFSGTYVRSP